MPGNILFTENKTHATLLVVFKALDEMFARKMSGICNQGLEM